MNTDYTLSVDYQNEYYSDVTLNYYVSYYRENKTHIVVKSFSNSSVTLNFPLSGEYKLIISAFKNGESVDSHTIECMIKGSRFDLPNNSVIELNKEITIPFVYFNPNNDNYEVEFEAREELFDNNANNIVIRRETKSRIAVTLKDYGCYYITAKVYNSSGTPVDRKYANITCLHRVDPQFVLYENTLISPDGYYGTWGLKYDVKFGEATTMAARFSCYVEQETERRRGYPIIGRRMDRQWRQRMIPIKLNRGRSSIYSLPQAAWSMRTSSQQQHVLIIRARYFI